MNIREWCEKNGVWYVKMDIEVPSACLAEAKAAHEAGFFSDYRFRGLDMNWRGSYACNLHGWVPKEYDVSKAWMFGGAHHYPDSWHGVPDIEMDPDNVKWGWSEVCEIAPETTRWLKEFPHASWKRCRYMVLEAGGYIASHTDASPDRQARGLTHDIWAQMNVALNNPEGFEFINNETDERLPFEDFTGWFFDNGVYHEVKNPHPTEHRYHLMMHGASNHDRRRLMLRSIIKQCGSGILRELDKEHIIL